MDYVTDRKATRNVEREKQQKREKKKELNDDWENVNSHCETKLLANYLKIKYRERPKNIK